MTHQILTISIQPAKIHATSQNKRVAVERQVDLGGGGDEDVNDVVGNVIGPDVDEDDPEVDRNIRLMP